MLLQVVRLVTTPTLKQIQRAKEAATHASLLWSKRVRGERNIRAYTRYFRGFPKTTFSPNTVLCKAECFLTDLFSVKLNNYWFFYFILIWATKELTCGSTAMLPLSNRVLLSSYCRMTKQSHSLVTLCPETYKPEYSNIPTYSEPVSQFILC